MAEVVYLLCAIASSASAVLLLRGYRNTSTRLLFWSCLCFVGLAANNFLLFIDLVIVPNVDLRILRSAVAIGSMAVLVFGLVQEVR